MTGASDLYGFLASTAADHGDRPFVWYEGETWTYEEAVGAVDRRAAMLSELGIGPGDRVALLSPTDPELLFFLFAAPRVGATAVPIDHRQERTVLSYLLSDADPSALVVDDAASENYRAVADSVGIEHVLTHDVSDPGDACDLDDAVAAAGAGSAEPVDPAPDDVAVINYTSGTTGPPKGVLNPHRAFVDAGRRAAEACSTGPEDRALLILPLFHANPITYGVMQMIAAGGSVALVRGFSASTFWGRARETGATYFTHVGSVLEILTRTAREGDVDPENPMRFAMGGAAHFDTESQRWFEETFDLQLIRLYGLSEVGAGLVTCCAYDSGADHAPTHQGSIEAQPFDVRILRTDAPEWVDAGETGEIVIRPDRPATMFAGYRGKAEETVEDWQDLWMHTGDLGRIEDGTLRFVGRVATNIRRGGENISPWEIESTVERWEEVRDVAAVGVPDEVLGEEIHLYVVPAEDVSEGAIHERCRAELADHLLPRYVTLVSELPRTSTQKIERAALSERGTDEAWDAEG